MALTVIPIDRTFGCVNSWLITEAFTSFIVFIYGQFSWKRTCFIIFTKLAYWPAFPTRRNARSETSCLNSFSKLEIDVQSSSRGTLFHILVYPEIIHVAPISVLHFQFWWIKWLKRWQQVGRCSIWYLTIEMGYQTSFLAPFDLPKSFLISSKFYRAFSTSVARFKERLSIWLQSTFCHLWMAHCNRSCVLTGLKCSLNLIERSLHLTLLILD